MPVLSKAIGCIQGVGAKPATIVFTAKRGDNGTFVQNRTYASVPIGTADTARHIVTQVSCNANNVTSVIVGGVSSTRVSFVMSAGVRYISIWVTNSPVTTGTTANISVNCSSATSEIGMGVFALYNAANPTTAYQKLTSTSATLNISSPENGCVAATGHVANDASIQTCTGDLTHAWNDPPTLNFEAIGGFGNTETANPSFLCSATGPSVMDAWVAVSWAPE